MPLIDSTRDLELGKASDQGRKEGEEEPLSVLYNIVYSFSLVVVTLGVSQTIYPLSESWVLTNIVGPVGILVGIFLLLNADLLVTYMRLIKEMHRFRMNNMRYKASLVVQKKKVEQLKQCSKALDRLQRHCHNNLQDMEKELHKMSATSRDRFRHMCKDLVWCLWPSNADIHGGKDLDNVIRTFSNVYARAVPDLHDRAGKLREGLAASPRWREVQQLSVNRLKFILAHVIFEEIADVKASVTRIIEAKTDARASGWHSNSMESMEERDTANEFGERLTLTASPSHASNASRTKPHAWYNGPAGEVAKTIEEEEGEADDSDADWADAEAFVNS